MRRFFYIFIVFLVGFNVSDVQKEIVSLRWNNAILNKLSSEVYVDMTFENAVFSDIHPKLPLFFKTIELIHEGQDFHLTVENPVFEHVKVKTLPPFAAELTDDFQIKKDKLKSGNTSQLQIQIVPFKKVNDELYFLKSFELKRVPIIEKSSMLAQTYSWKNKSVLETGKWVKISTSGRGIYKIPHSTLTKWGFSNPSKVNVYGSGGTILSENPGEIEFDDLNQSAVWHGNNNGSECLFFYEPGNTKWTPSNTSAGFGHSIDYFSNKGYFYLTENVGTQKTASLLTEVQDPVTDVVSAVDAFLLHELELENLLPSGSGKQWYGDRFRNGSIKNIDFILTDMVNATDVRINVKAAARSFQSSEMPVLFKQNELGKLQFYDVDTGDDTSTYADIRESSFVIKPETEKISVTLKYFAKQINQTTDDNANAWLDFIEVNYRRKLKLIGDVLFFRDRESLGSEKIVEFNIEGAAAGTKLFDVTDVNNVVEVPSKITGNIAKAVRPAKELREYAVFNQNGNFKEPEFVSELENQNLHGLETPEFLIVTHSKFINSANTLADFHRNYDGMKVEVVDAEKVYNEFSSGKKDATGIRNFIKMFYDRGERLKYVLLFGDGSYDNKNIKQKGKNFIPTFQSANSLNPVASFVTDDYFVILDANESVYNGAVDLGIGRIPATTNFEAELVVDKVLNYYSPEALGVWRNVVCFIGDDEDGSLHMRDSEKLANYVNLNHSEFITDKIYFDAFIQEATPAGESYPEVTEAINKRVKDGVLILNYIGHANDRFMADEHVLDVSNINSWSNSNALPIFVTATCEFSRFDSDETSAGEYVLFNPNGGGIGLFSTTRVVFAYSNFYLSEQFYNYVFKKDENGEHYRMGDIMRLAKINTINTTNKRNFSLLADPALKLTYPKNKVITTSINQKDATSNPDTIGALQEITITGYIADSQGNKLNSFSGNLTPTVYDKEIMMKTLGNAGQTPMDFKVQENIIYKGLASITNGDFKFSFVIPKDISYNLGKGKIIYYANNKTEDAHGAFENFIIGGSGSQISDNQGPSIEVYLDSPDFVNGDKTSKNPTLLAFLSDENGINTVGTGIGHDITAVLDNDYSSVTVLNNFYRADIDDYTGGTIQYPFKNLSVGKHTLKLKAWDVANNSSEVEIEFEVSGDFVISQISNYPNPVSEYTFFTFEHNQADATLDAVIEVFDQNGRLIDKVETQIGSNGIKSNPLRWDINELNMKLRSGIYIYRITAQNSDSVIASKTGKMVIAR